MNIFGAYLSYSTIAAFIAFFFSGFFLGRASVLARGKRAMADRQSKPCNLEEP
ncbi:MAG: hypothetical protein OXG59_07670 [Gammaproteobacteria bacterium]|nr:hypothetical protein [Gammaproteobacteria bacterium]